MENETMQSSEQDTIKVRLISSFDSGDTRTVEVRRGTTAREFYMEHGPRSLDGDGVRSASQVAIVVNNAIPDGSRVMEDGDIMVLSPLNHKGA